MAASETTETVSVYLLKDPRDGAVRYVGVSKNPEQRLRSHIKQPVSDDMADWIGALSAIGERPSLETVESGPPSEIATVEQKWIDKYDDSQLLNKNDSHRYKADNIDPVDAVISVFKNEREETGESRMSTRMVSERVEIPRSTVSSAMRQLTAAGWVEKKSRSVYEFVDDPRENSR